ncbi:MULTISPECIES: GntR family transcriptional regulator [unclassified Sporosarcina]|uniref:GntR family transcriptional regulator n=1 Tax=unclassified Sporosarcina TaxID=2647733 RepID=UPI00203D34F5|nr:MULTISPECIES: GntR family transcriptional regulator [unclassified Sporosarcina]GKV64027.1 GntR family transcriptional regulator [Sporosarcina sp. NCCP-2331]GLB56399.1 GntR family transcriptional regulator [Sporosarcina sp. NCCP-2378]
MSIENIKTVGRQPLNVMVYENIKVAIVEGDIAPGTRLTETKVSEQLGVSTTPVREAFRRLASEGLVKIIPWRGAIVQEFTTKQLANVYTCRESLEALAVDLAIDNMDDNGISELYNFVERSVETTSSSEYFELSSAIHNTILRYADNDTLSNLLVQLNDVIYHNRNISSFNDERRNEIYKEHMEIVKAIEEKDKTQAKLAMQSHVRNGFNYIQNHLAK